MGLAADPPPRTWKRTSSLTRSQEQGDAVLAADDTDWVPARGLARASSGGSPPPGVDDRAALGSSAAAALKLATMKLSAGGAERPGATTPPLSPIKASWAQHAALSDAAGSSPGAGMPAALSPRALEPKPSPARPPHRRTTSWSGAGSSANAGRPPRDVYGAVTTPDGRHALIRSLSGKGEVEVLLVHDAAAAAAAPPAQGCACPVYPYPVPTGMVPVYAVAAPGAPGGVVYQALQLAPGMVLPGAPLGPGSPPPLGAVHVVGYAPVPAGDPRAYLSPRAGMPPGGGGSAPASPAPARTWQGAAVASAAHPSLAASERVSSPASARNHTDPFGESAVW
ncbi:hypothetical protein WJX81_001176 [Elliptochloris bilobata]|uniref:Uncharacterized protein n=1 Tax=Elliptochloris bilobata TaxID=381761 RepID=A0AAW1QU92_9CHLO